jgi:hypothetical protein
MSEPHAISGGSRLPCPSGCTESATDPAFLQSDTLSPDFTLLLITGVLFGVAVAVFIAWRFSVADALAFVLVAGLFPAVMDFLSSFAAQNYVYGAARLAETAR